MSSKPRPASHLWTLVAALALAATLFLPGSRLLPAQTTITLAQQYYGLGDLECAVYSPDGNYILTGGTAGAFLWDINTGKVVRMFFGHRGRASSVAFSPDGTKVLTGSSDHAAKLSNAADGVVLCTFSGHTEGLYSVAFSPDGTKVLTGSFDETAKLWNASDGTQIRTFSGHTGFVLSVAFSPDGTKVLTGSDDNTAKLWNASNGTLIRTLSGHTGSVYSVAFSPDGMKVLTGSLDATAKLWNAADGTEIRTFSGPANYVTSVAFSPDGTKVLTACYTTSAVLVGEAMLWNAADGTLLRTFSGHTSRVCSVAFSPDGTRVLTGATYNDNTAKLWDASDGSLLRTFSGHTIGVWSVALSPDGTKVLTGSMDRTAKLWNASDGTELRTFSGHTGEVYSVAFSPDGTKALTGWTRRDNGDWNRFQGAALWDITSGTLIRTLGVGQVASVAFSPDGTRALTSGPGGGTNLWNVDDGTSISHFVRSGSVGFSPDGLYLLIGGWLYDAQNYQELHAVQGTVFSPDGSMVLGASGSNVTLLRTSDGALVRTFSGHTANVTSVAFSPDGTKVLSGAFRPDNTAKLWNAADGTLLRTFSGHVYDVNSVAFSHDGTRILTGGIDGTARMWQIYRAKAVIVAGGGPFYGNAIAEQTKQLAAYCYKICRRRGYAPNEIQYLSAFGPQDADGDGNNDVDSSASIANLHDALDRFTSDTARLFIYFVDHGYRVGGGMYFQMNPTQMLAATELDSWLDARQTRTDYPPCHVTLIVDSCYSGNFVSACMAPPGKRRLVIASTTSDTVAIFLPPPSLTSFSYQFLGALYMGYKVQEAFASARQFFNTLGAANQSPWIDADGDGRYTVGVDDSTTGPAAEEFFGTSWAYAAGGGWEPPAFAQVTPNQSPPLGTTITIWVEMLPYQVPERVWATILPPAAKPLAGQALTDLPRVELQHTTGTRWEAPFGGFDTVGTYVVAHVAAFEGARITQPVYSQINVGAPADPPPIKAVLVSGRDAGGSIASQTITLANLAYRVSRHRGYKTDEIRYLSAFGRQDADGDRMNDVADTATVASLTTVLSTWASTDCQRLLVYLVGLGDRVGGQAVFRLSPTEVLTSPVLDAQLDTLQNSGVTSVVVVADFPYAAEFLRGCQPPPGKRRVLIAGTDSANAVFLAPPQHVSFSFNFLSAAHMGHNLDASFEAARQFFGAWSGYRQRPWLDDDGDLDSDKWDGAHARTLYWGYPWAFAGAEGGELPFILDAGPRDAVATSTQILLWARLMEGPVPTSVTATIIPPTVAYSPGQPITEFPIVPLTREAPSWRWSSPAILSSGAGVYTVLFQAFYENDQTASPVLTHLTFEGDRYEPDDAATSATEYLFSESPYFPDEQLHNFHRADDSDWVRFYGLGGHPYTLHVNNPGPNCDAGIELYDSTTATVPLASRDWEPPGTTETLQVTLPARSGLYYWRVYNASNPPLFGDGTSYTLKLTRDWGANNGLAIALGSRSAHLTFPQHPNRGPYNLYRTRLGSTDWGPPVNGPASIPTEDYDEMGLQPETDYLWRGTVLLPRPQGGSDETHWGDITYGRTLPISARAISFDAATSSVSETAGTVYLGLHVSIAPTDAVRVWYRLEGTAVRGADYTVVPPTTVTLVAGVVQTSIPITIIDDAVVEPDETIVVRLMTTINAEPGAISSHTLTVRDNDPAPVMNAEPPFTRGTTNRVTWGAVTGAVGYWCECDDAANFSSPQNSGWIAGTQWIATPLSNNVLYYYRVKCRNAAMTESGWSNVVSSRQDATPPTAPGTPRDTGAYTSSTLVRFTWTAAGDTVSGVASYDLQVGTTPGGNNVFNQNVGSAMTYVINGSNGQRLYARVRAYDRVGYVGPWSGSSDGITVDTVAPRLTNASARDYRTVHVVFSEPVRNADIAANYSCTGGLRIVGVFRLADNWYRLYTTNQVPGVNYTLTVGSGVRDFAGNSVNPSYCSRTFGGGRVTRARHWSSYQ